MAKDGSRAEASLLVNVGIEAVILVCVVYVQALFVSGTPPSNTLFCRKANLLQPCMTFIVTY
eukprot:3887838-Ditylum_brightwellii.AAC.1